jgi:hypothetical protein
MSDEAPELGVLAAERALQAAERASGLVPSRAPQCPGGSGAEFL